MNDDQHFPQESERLLSQVADFYHQKLLKNPKVLDFLATINISPKAIESFKVGFCDGTLTQVLPSRHKKSGHLLRQQLAKLHLLNPKTGRETFRHHLTLPLKYPNGSFQNLVGQRIEVLQKQKEPFLTLNNQGIFNPIEAPFDEWILSDSFLDALIFWSAGVKNTSFMIDPLACSQELLELLLNHQVEKLFLAFSNNASGDTLAHQVASQLSQTAIKPFRLCFPKEQTISEMMQIHPSPPDFLRTLTYEAKPIKILIPKKTFSHLFDLADQMTGEILGSDCQMESQGNHLIFKRYDRIYRVQWLQEQTDTRRFKINLLLIKGQQLFQNTLDLYLHRQRQYFAGQVAVQMKIAQQVIQTDLGKLLLHLEAHQQRTWAHQEPSPSSSGGMSDKEKQDALKFLQNPDLVQEILQDYNQMGIMGEGTNKLVAYLGAVSRKLHFPGPLSIIIQSASSAGKTTLMDATLHMMPQEEVKKFSALTPKSLFYMTHQNLKHKILAIAEDKGLEKAAYPLKLLQSDEELSIASTAKDKNGHFQTQKVTVQGPVAFFFATTSPSLDEELANRAVVLSADESQEQTLAIHQQQRRAQTLKGLMARKQVETIHAKHQNAQRLLQTLHVVNPYSERLSFPTDRLNMRRDHMKYLTLIASITLLHQFQRPLKRSGEI